MSYRVYRALSNVVWFVARPWATFKRARGGREWVERLGGPPVMRPGGVWVHAASVGEVTAASPLVRALSRGGASVLLTVMTPTGREVAERASGADATVAYVPLDFVPAVRSALQRARPRGLLLVETEIWPNLISEAASAGTTVGIVGGRLSERSVRRYLAPGSPFGGIRGAISFVACQSDDDRDRFLKVGLPASRVTVVGNSKFDVLEGPPSDVERAAIAARLATSEGTPVVVFGCVRPAEEEAVARAAATIVEERRDVRVIVAPRHLDRVEPLARRLASEGAPTARWSSLDPGRTANERAIVLDTTGELAGIYSIAAVAFVGGTLAPYGGHNPLEPAARGVPVLLGPHTENCRDSAEMLKSAGAALEVRTSSDLRAGIVRLLSDERERSRMARLALEVIEAGRGATERTMALLRAEGVLGERAA